MNTQTPKQLYDMYKNRPPMLAGEYAFTHPEGNQVKVVYDKGGHFKILFIEAGQRVWIHPHYIQFMRDEQEPTRPQVR